MSLKRFTDAEELSAMASDDRSQPEMYLGYLLVWLIFIGLIVLLIFPMIDESWISMSIIVVLLGAYVMTKRFFGKRGYFTA